MGWLIAGGIAVVVLIALVVLIIGIYNKAVTLKNRYQNAFAHRGPGSSGGDLIPNLVETAKGYMSHERELSKPWFRPAIRLSAVCNAAQNPGDPNAMQQFAGAEGMLGGHSAGSWPLLSPTRISRPMRT